ncbi:hypothetical protein DIS24_g927 [Lasiodiplodia hormozganensis]|uniref:Uncharacterized protein n=1 Tax=Lasiodiplodia hormozganensis TaxID=869390 RepID=A0AA40D5K8_9PEZI|nr:hypothetical protein DIS24_g927 [Lasiodiplodia hormozganensis]
MADDPPEPSSSARSFPVQPKQSSALRHRLQRTHSTPWDPSASFSSIAPPPPVLRRRSSMLSDFSSIRSSTDNLLNPGSRDADKLEQDEPSPWHSLPLVFAILPAVSGIFFTNGSAVVTDILLLGLASLLLNWCVRMPWDWYCAAQMPAPYAEAAGIRLSDTIPEEDSEDDEAIEDAPTADTKTASEHSDTAADMPAPERSPQYVAAVKELQSDQLYALAACFLGPVVGAYLLHAIRASLSRPSEGLVSNYNLTIFLLAAEVRPASHLLRMLRARTMYLQRIVREQAEPDLKSEEPAVSDLGRRLSELESHMADVASANAVSAKEKGKSAGSAAPAEVANIVRQSFQPQLDALNRAVRRYEKRATTQTMATEARLQDLESRLKDALALAAAAARSGQQKKPGVVSILFDWLSTLLMIPLQALWALMVYPFQMLSSIAVSIKRFLFGYTKKVDKKGKGKAKSASDRGHGSLNGYRAQAGPSGTR